ncbi:TPA: YbjQ family protein, partial [Photobacterium damselae]
GYTEMYNEARSISVERMLDEARNLGADAVVGVRFTTSSVTEGASEVMAFGTAVTLQKR